MIKLENIVSAYIRRVWDIEVNQGCNLARRKAVGINMVHGTSGMS